FTLSSSLLSAPASAVIHSPSLHDALPILVGAHAPDHLELRGLERLRIECTTLIGGVVDPRDDQIRARIDDPTYEGGAFDPETFEAAKFEVIRGVSTNQDRKSVV